MKPRTKIKLGPTSESRNTLLNSLASRLQIHPNFESYRNFLVTVFDQFGLQGELVAQGDRNTIKKVTAKDGTVFSIKKFKTPNLFQGLVYRFLRKSKAKRSYLYANRLIDLGIQTPVPVAYLECFSGGLKESFFVSEHLDYDFDFRVLNHNPKWPDRVEILKQFTSYTFNLHEKEIQFLDHSPGNTLIVKKGGKQYDFYLIDLNRMRFGKMDLHARMKNFRRLWLSKGMINTMAPVYAAAIGVSEEKVKPLMTQYSRTFQKKVNAKKLRRRKLS